MNQAPGGEQAYVCPMHSEVRQSGPGKCPRCRMDLIPEGARFGLLRHIAKNRLMLVVMLLIMMAIMAGAMMMMR